MKAHTVFFACALVLSACADLTALEAPGQAAGQRVQVAQQGPLPPPAARPRDARPLSLERADCGPRAPLSLNGPCPVLDLPERDLGPDTEQFFANQRAANANQQRQIDLRSRQQVNAVTPSRVQAGERSAIQREQIRLQQDALRASRDRLRTAPYGRTVGSIDY